MSRSLSSLSSSLPLPRETRTLDDRNRRNPNPPPRTPRFVFPSISFPHSTLRPPSIRLPPHPRPTFLPHSPFGLSPSYFPPPLPYHSRPYFFDRPLGSFLTYHLVCRRFSGPFVPSVSGPRSNLECSKGVGLRSPPLSSRLLALL